MTEIDLLIVHARQLITCASPDGPKRGPAMQDVGLLDAGCALALSTDINPGSAPCPSMPLVMAIAARYQHLLPAEVFNASTINAAHAIGMGRRVGSLEPGKLADLLILKTGDYRHLCYQFGDNLVQTVVKSGSVSQG